MHKHATYKDSLRKLSLERNIIQNSLTAITNRCQLSKLEYLDLNLNQIQWDEHPGVKVVRRICEKKRALDADENGSIKVQAVELIVT